MKKMFALAALAAFLCTSTQVISAPVNGDREDGFISVNASATDEIDPNEAKISFAIEANGKEINKVTEEINQVSSKLTEVLKSKLGEGDTIKTATYTVSPVYYEKEKKRQLTGYRAATKMTVTTKNITNIASLISVALNNGATEVSGLDFSSTDMDDVCNELVAKASRSAQISANSVAKSLGTVVNGIKSINTSCGTQATPRVYGMMKNSMDSAAGVAESPAIEPGTLKINANVYANFYVK